MLLTSLAKGLPPRGVVIGRTLIFQVRRSAELQGSMYGRTVPNRTVQSSAISSAKFGNKPHIVRP